MKELSRTPSATRLIARAAAAAAICAALSGAFAVAQDAPAPGGTMRGPGMGAMGGMASMMNQMLCGPTEHVEGKLAYLKTELKLSDQQQAAWNSFADAYRAAMQKTAATCAGMMSASGDHQAHHGVLGHLTMMEHHMADHLDEVRAVKAALEPLYAALNDEQKKFLDHSAMHVLGLMGGMGGGMMGGMMGGMGEGGGMGGMKH
ncbi:MAG TPA: Spy/CpxP family protein refolding chaperone [Methylocystis sp.]|nr:Spy/CpxP family protein refolding chaperone [Methylocystis sp.]